MRAHLLLSNMHRGYNHLLDQSMSPDPSAIVPDDGTVTPAEAPIYLALNIQGGLTYVGETPQAYSTGISMAISTTGGHKNDSVIWSMFS
jgi:hypothetical protein